VLNLKFLSILLYLFLICSSVRALNSDVVNELSKVYSYDKDVSKIIKDDYELAILFGGVPEDENILFENLYKNHALLNQFTELYYVRLNRLYSRHKEDVLLNLNREDLEEDIKSVRKIYKTHFIMGAFTDFCKKTYDNYVIEPYVAEKYIERLLGNLLTAHFIKSFEAQESCQFLSKNPAALQKLQDTLSNNYALPFHFIDLERSTVVKQSDFGIFDLNNKNKDCIVSSPLLPCMAIIIYNSRLETYAYLHVDHLTSIENIVGSFNELHAFTSTDSIEVKIITYRENRFAADLEHRFSPIYFGHKIAHLPFTLIEFLRRHIFPRIANLSVMQNDQRALHIGDKEYPELVLLQNAKRDEAELKYALEESTSFLYNLDYYEALLNSEKNPLKGYFDYCALQTQDPELLDFDMKNYLTPLKTNFSFGIDKYKRWFTTNFALSARALPSKSSAYDLSRLSYKTRGGIPINSGHSWVAAMQKIIK